jgi:hypothetical protein
MQPFYVPQTADTPPLPGGSSAKPADIGIVGYGSDGGDPIKFSLHNGGEDTTFFKLFVSSSYIDMKILDQRVDALSRVDRPRLPYSYIWDAWTFQITSRPC